MLTHFQEEAEQIYKNGQKAVVPAGNAGRQTGAGIYALRGFRQWNSEVSTMWDCAMTIDSDVWNGWNKIWLPRFFEFPEDKEKDPQTCKPRDLCGMTPIQKKDRARFLQYIDPSYTVDNTVIFSNVVSHKDKVQCYIPNGLVKTNQIWLTPCTERLAKDSERLGVEFGTAEWDLTSLPGWGLGVELPQ
ncbi:Uncharacterized protein PECH_005542 [Penicillium ucsense]|uniref:Uncharacterized protein n=1 Tax=Penicillium ucsense TaxID=2839758 RepID=A0A8J8WCL9_9EURO|nr:Uncharacterized protein PECM_005245 [Penicillium ucsense]KAF7722162.1 Uncharacterized protein PECH_005542 [Penicillium ucsense]